TAPSSMLATKTSPFTGVCSSIASSLCYLQASVGDLTPLWSHKILRGGFAVQSVGDGCCELLEFMHIEDAAGQHVYGNHNDTNYVACDDGIGDGGHGPTTGITTHRVEQGNTEDAGDHSRPPGTNVGTDNTFDPVVAEIAQHQNMGEPELQEVDDSEDYCHQIGAVFHGHQRRQSVGQTQRYGSCSDLHNHGDQRIFGSIEHAQQVEMPRA